MPMAKVRAKAGEGTGLPGEVYRHLLECAPVAMAVHSGGRVVLANRAAAELLGSADPSDLVGKDLLAIVHPGERASVRERLRRMKEGDRVSNLEERLVRLDGGIIDVLVSASGVTWDGEPAILVAATDVTGRTRTEELRGLSATHDPLTGIASRALLDAEMARLSAGRRFPVSVIVASVDGLGETVVRRGHVAGDVLLRETADVLLSQFRAEDTVARLGGDEFAVLVPGAGRDEAARAVERVRHSLARRGFGPAGPLAGLSVGCATASAGSDLGAAFRRADAAMDSARALPREPPDPPAGQNGRSWAASRLAVDGGRLSGAALPPRTATSAGHSWERKRGIDSV